MTSRRGRFVRQRRSRRAVRETSGCDPLLAYRERFPILNHTNYLISNSLGAVPRGGRDQPSELSTRPGRPAACGPGKTAGGPWPPSWAIWSLR